MSKPYLSIIVPAHNEEQRLPTTLEKIEAFIALQSFSTEVLVVENGSSDRTLAIAQGYAEKKNWLRVIHEDGRGKGLAVKRGMLEAIGDYRFFADADLSMPLDQINRFIPPANAEIDIAIASREAPGAVRYNEPPFRHFTGRVFNMLVRVITLPGLQDTQCGFKCFRGQVADEIFPYQRNMGWAFDVEVLFIARLHGYRIIEVPIDWYFDSNSKVRVVKDSFRMMRDLVGIRRNGHRGLYSAR